VNAEDLEAEREYIIDNLQKVSIIQPGGVYIINLYGEKGLRTPLLERFLQAQPQHENRPITHRV
jgi:hypothetical protein